MPSYSIGLLDIFGFENFEKNSFEQVFLKTDTFFPYFRLIILNQTQKDLDQLSTLVAEYEGESGKYTVNNKAKIVQQSLMKLGYPLPRFKDDGKFGPETLNALKKFQQDNGLTSSIGKMDKLTVRKLSELLKSKNIAGSEELQNSLNSM